MSAGTIWLIIAAIAVGGFALRGAFIMLPLLPRELPPRLRLLLGLVPAAAFAALVAPSVFLDGGHLQLFAPAPLAGAVVLLVSSLRNNLALSIACGLGVYALLDLVM